MSNIADTNHFDTTNEYNIAEGSSSNNIVFFDIVNCVEVMPGWENISYHEKFTPDKRWNDGNKVDAGWTKRFGFKEYMRENGMYLADEVIIDYQRYSMRVSEEYTNGKRDYKIYRHDNHYTKGCQKIMRCGCGGKRCEIRSGKLGKCDHPTMGNIVGPKGFPTTTTLGTVFNEYSNGIAQGGFNASNFPGVSIGDYVYIDTDQSGIGQTGNVGLGQRRQVVAINGGLIYVNAPRVGLISPDGSDGTISSGNVVIKTFETIGDILYVNDCDGIRLIHTSNECGDDRSSSILGATVNHQFPIFDVTNYNGKLAFITGGSIFFAQGGSNVGLIENQIIIGDEYDKILPLDHYLLLLGPNRSSIVYNWNRDNNGSLEPRLYDRGRDFNFGYFNIGSYKRYTREGNDEFIIYDSWGRLMKYDLYAHDDGFSNVIFKLQGTEIGNRIVRKYIQMQWLCREKGAEVYIDEWKEGFRIFLTTSEKDPDSETGTIILHFDEHGKYWHRRVICGIKITGEYCGMRRGNRYLCHEGKDDDGQEIKQIVNTYHGDRTRRSNKEYHHIGFHLGYDTNLSKGNHHVRIIEHMEGLKKETKYSTLHENVMLQRWSHARHKREGLMIKKEMHAAIFTDDKISGDISEDIWKHIKCYCNYDCGTYGCADIKADPEIAGHRDGCHDGSDGKDGNKKTPDQYSYMGNDLTLGEDAIIYDRGKYSANKIFVELMACGCDSFTLYGFHFSSKYRDTNVHSQSMRIQKNDAYVPREKLIN